VLLSPDCHPQITHADRYSLKGGGGRLGGWELAGCGTHSCTLCKYLLCVDEADEQDTDDDGPLMKPLVAPWQK